MATQVQLDEPEAADRHVVLYHEVEQVVYDFEICFQVDQADLLQMVLRWSDQERFESLKTSV